jgi:hypothetical protein
MFVMKKFIYSLLSSIAFISCNSSENNSSAEEIDKTIYIDHYKLLCNTSVPAMCYRSRESIDTNWVSEIHGIQHFDYEWGYTYKILVHVYINNDPDLVANSPRYTLLEVIEKERVAPNTLFDIAIPRHSYIYTSDDNKYYLSEEKEFICSDENYAALDTLISQKTDILLEFSHQAQSDAPLLLTQIKCSAPAESFDEDCL